MNDMYVMKSGMTKEQLFRLHLINGFNFVPIVADAIVDLSIKISFKMITLEFVMAKFLI